MKNCVAFALLALCIASCHGIVWKDCGSKLSKIKSVMVSGCDKTDVCKLIIGTSVNFTVDFITNSVAADAMSVTTVYINDVPMPVPPPHPDACLYAKSGISCPLKSGMSYAFHETVDILSIFPQVDLTAEWELQSGGKEIFCVQFDACITGDEKGRDENRMGHSNRIL